MGRTSLPGVHAAGDMAHVASLPMPMSSVLTAAASGQVAAAVTVGVPDRGLTPVESPGTGQSNGSRPVDNACHGRSGRSGRARSMGASLRHRAARYGWVTAGLVALALALLALAVFALATGVPDRQNSSVLLPVNVEFSWPGAAVFLAAAALAMATFVGLAALQTAATMQVLNRIVESRHPFHHP